MHNVEHLELRLNGQLRGKTLLGEITFSEEDCEQAARIVGRKFHQFGVAPGLDEILRKCPITFAVWLVNEAFYCYDGGYWPTVTAKVGVTAQNNSSRLGAAFIHILQRFRLPLFRRLNTHWSYLGPILAHCGVPKSRLPQFFDKVLPLAARIGVGSAEGLAELQQQLPSLGVSRSIEWFIRFGDTVSADFVRRCLDMYNMADAGGALPSAPALGVPQRVWREFHEWTRTAQIDASRASAPRLQRPRLYVDPSRGLRLELPAQRCQHASLEWDVRIDAAPPIQCTVPRFAGEGFTEPDDVLLGAPFASAIARLKEPGGGELGMWVLNGLPTGRPVVFFDPEDFSVLPGGISAAPQGVLAPAGYRVLVRLGADLIPPPVLSRLGRLPFGWGAFEASICDLSGSTAVVLIDEAGSACGETELGEREAAVPRLDGETLPYLATSDQTRIFVGSAPALLIPVSRPVFDEQWTIAIDPIGQHCGAVLPRIAPPSASLFAQTSPASANELIMPLDQPQLLDAEPWGVFAVQVKGPLGQGARFQIAVVPPLRVEHDWSERRQGNAVRTTVYTRAEVATATTSASDRVLFIERERTPLRLKCDGYGGQRWSIPVDLHLPIPSWSVQEEESQARLTTWSSKAFGLTLSEGDGRSPHLMLRTATPWGVPQAATLQLRYNDRLLFSAPASIDAHGYAELDLQPFLANARQSGYPRVQLRLDLQLARVVSVAAR